MPQLQALLLCDLVVTTPEGKVQLQGLFDVINTLQLPIRHGRMWVFFRFILGDGEFPPDVAAPTMSLFLKRPGGETDRLPEMQVKVGHGGTVQGYVQLQGLPLKHEGEHWLELHYEQQVIGSCRFFVRMTGPRTDTEPVAASTTVH